MLVNKEEKTIITKGANDIQLVVDEEFENDIHVTFDEAATIADEQDTSNQSQYLLTYSKLNDKLREKLTPIFNRKHYASLPQTSLGFYDNRSRRNSYNYRAYKFQILLLSVVAVAVNCSSNSPQITLKHIKYTPSEKPNTIFT